MHLSRCSEAAVLSRDETMSRTGVTFPDRVEVTKANDGLSCNANAFEHVVARILSNQGCRKMFDY